MLPYTNVAVPAAGNVHSLGSRVIVTHQMAMAGVARIASPKIISEISCKGGSPARIGTEPIGRRNSSAYGSGGQSTLIATGRSSVGPAQAFALAAAQRDCVRNAGPS